MAAGRDRVAALDCPVCHGAGAMVRARAARFGLGLRLLGCIIATPSAIGAAFGALVVWATMRAHHDVALQAATTAEQTGAAIGAGLGMGVGVFLIAASLVGGLVGWLLLSRHRVWRCDRCGHILPRA